MAAEALSYGVPIIGWPMAAEQFYNVKLLEEEIGVCLEVARGRISEVKCEDIVAKIDLVMNDTEKGKEMRKKACEVRNIINNSIADKEVFKGVSAKAMDDFLNAAMLIREQAKRIPRNSISTQNSSQLLH
uniref:Anthocyanidin 3-O-glucosyltransferase n=1 Tax=Populus trichocarpa TaxID=3694 RepID=A0A2K2BQV7_POPTR